MTFICYANALRDVLPLTSFAYQQLSAFGHVLMPQADLLLSTIRVPLMPSHGVRVAHLASLHLFSELNIITYYTHSPAVLPLRGEEHIPTNLLDPMQDIFGTTRAQYYSIFVSDCEILFQKVNRRIPVVYSWEHYIFEKSNLIVTLVSQEKDIIIPKIYENTTYTESIVQACADPMFQSPVTQSESYKNDLNSLHARVDNALLWGRVGEGSPNKLQSALKLQHLLSTPAHESQLVLLFQITK